MTTSSKDYAKLNLDKLQKELARIPKMKKRGGPYPLKDRTERRNKVFHMYVEKGYSAARIAKELVVQRNTINSDIRECCLNLEEELPENEVGSIFLSQLHALRYQKTRLIDKSEREIDPKTELMYDRMIIDIDHKIAQMILKMMTSKNGILSSVELKKRLGNEKNGRPFNYTPGGFVIPSEMNSNF